MDLFGEVDRAENIQNFRKDGKTIEVDLSKMPLDACKVYVSSIIDTAEIDMNGIRPPKRNRAEYYAECWKVLQIEKYVIGLIQKRNAK